MSIEVRSSGELRVMRGCLAVFCDPLDALAHQSLSQITIPAQYLQNHERRDDSLQFHMTLLTAKEMKSLSTCKHVDLLQEFKESLVGQKWLPLGIGNHGECHFIVVIFPRAAAMRRKFGLPHHYFHITLGFPTGVGWDRHDVPKDALSLVVVNYVQQRQQQHHVVWEEGTEEGWLHIAQDNFVAIRHKKATTGVLGLDEICNLLREMIPSLEATRPREGCLIQQVAKLWCKASGLAKDYETVIMAADVWLREEPENAQALGFQGFAHYKLQHYAIALTTLDRAWFAFGKLPPYPDSHRTQAHQVEDCLVSCCAMLNREMPLPPLVKFPRTSHLFRPEGSKAITDDDEVLPKYWYSDTRRMMNYGETVVTTVQEKVDGSNLGFSLSYNGRDILVQNRSHYLHSGEHPQYGALPTWIDIHSEALLRILDAPNKRSSRHGWILFGEWMMARHSIPYTRLPGQFVAFDLYDIGSGRFVSQPRLHSLLQGSGIPVCPCLVERTFGPDIDLETELLRLLETQSCFRGDGGPVEGVVFRIEDRNWVKERCKLVRPDFVAGCSIGHWSKRSIERQRVDYEFAESYLNECYVAAAQLDMSLPKKVDNPRQRVVVVYKDQAKSQEPRIVMHTDSQRNLVENPLEVIMPRNLSWLWPNEVAVSSTPKNAEQIQAFQDKMNVGLVITLTQEEPLQSDWFSEECCNYFVPVANFLPPTTQQMDDIGDDIVRAVVSGRAVLEHCGGGKGRAGTVAACLLLRFGVGGIWARIREENPRRDVGRRLAARAPFMGSDKAIALIRRNRPGSMETQAQEEFVREYAQHLWRLGAAEEEMTLPEELNYLAYVPGVTIYPPWNWSPKFIVLMGIPGSGKSTVGALLSKAGSRFWKDNNKFVHANQDDMGHRACQEYVGRMRASVSRGDLGGIIVDCTNVTAKHRREWLAVMHQPARDEVALIFVDTPLDVCISRVRARVDHPTIPFGWGDHIVSGFAKQLEPPTEEEKKTLFGLVRVVRSWDDLEPLLAIWGVMIWSDHLRSRA